MREPLEHRECDVPPAVLHTRQVSHVDTCTVRELILRQPQLLAPSPHVVADHGTEIHPAMGAALSPFLE
jgi:hypothetical protein